MAMDGGVLENPTPGDIIGGVLGIVALAVIFFPLAVCLVGFVYEAARWFHRWHIAPRKPGYELRTLELCPHERTELEDEGLRCVDCNDLIEWDLLPESRRHAR